MTCTFAVAISPVMSGGQLTGIDVAGQVQYSTGQVECSSLTITVSCGPVSVEQSVPIQMWTPAFGGFNCQFTNIPSGMERCCGGNVTVTVGCPACGYQTFLMPLNCSGQCPNLGAITCTVGPCQFDGTVQLNCNATVITLGSAASVNVQWQVNGSPVAPPVTVTSANTSVPGSFTLNSTGQTVTLSLAVVTSLGTKPCPPIEMQVTLPNCAACLPISISDVAGDCNPDGTRPVTITAVLTGGTATTQITATMTGPCGVVNGSGTGTLTLTSSCNLAPGTYTVTVTSGECPRQTYTFTVAECCPTFAFSETVDPCNVDGRRWVTVTAILIAGSPSTSISATMTGPCGTVNGSGAGTVTLTSSCNLLPGTYTVTVTTAGCPPQPYTFTVPECCPKIVISDTVGHCNPNGTRPVIVTAVLTAGSPGTSISATMTGPCGTVNGSGTGTVTLTSSCNLAPGTYTVTVSAGQGCPTQTYTLTVPECCPKIVISDTVGHCNPDGTRPVTVTAVLTAGSAGTFIHATMTTPCGTVTGSGAGTVTLTKTCNLNSGTYTVTVTAAGCPSQTYTFSVQDCCPTVDFQAVVGGIPICNAQGTRPVVITATVTPNPGVMTTATLTDTTTGSVMATGSGSTTFVLTGSGNYTAGTHQVEVSFSAPLNCPPQFFQFCVPVCETLACFTKRGLFLVAITTFLAITVMDAVAALAAYLDGVTSGTLWWVFGRYEDYLVLVGGLAVIQAVALVAAILLFVWWFLCIRFWIVQIGGCCYSCCTFLVTLWQIPLMVALCVLWFLATSWALNLVAVLILLLIAYLIYLWWKANCCPAKCDALFYIVLAFLWAAMAITAIDMGHVTADSVTAPYAVSAYIPWFVALLWFVTSAVRFILGLLAVMMFVAYVSCLTSEPQ